MRVFYDLTCPFCYVAQPFNKQLVKSGARLTELPFQAHPEVPKDGMYLGPRRGPMYDNIAARAKAANLPLKWRERLPNSRLALAAAEWTRQKMPEKADEVREKLFYAHFAGDRDIGDMNVVVDILGECGVEKGAAQGALQDGSAMKFVDEAAKIAREVEVSGTPSYESGDTVISGQQEAEVRRLVEKERKEAL